jgi:hypothetical protein
VTSVFCCNLVLFLMKKSILACARHFSLVFFLNLSIVLHVCASLCYEIYFLWISQPPARQFFGSVFFVSAGLDFHVLVRCYVRAAYLLASFSFYRVRLRFRRSVFRDSCSWRRFRCPWISLSCRPFCFAARVFLPMTLPARVPAQCAGSDLVGSRSVFGPVLGFLLPAARARPGACFPAPLMFATLLPAACWPGQIQFPSQG